MHTAGMESVDVKPVDICPSAAEASRLGAEETHLGSDPFALTRREAARKVGIFLAVKTI